MMIIFVKTQKREPYHANLKVVGNLNEGDSSSSRYTARTTMLSSSFVLKSPTFSSQKIA